MNVAGVDIRDAQRVSGGHICAAWRGVTGNGEVVFAKTLAAAPAGFFAAEADGLAWLTVAGGPPLPRVRAVSVDGLVLEWIDSATPTAQTAEDFGRRLAAMHAAGAAPFGRDADGFIGSVPLPNTPAATWSEFYVERRVLPYVDVLTAEQRRDVERACARITDLAGPPEPPARIHGDLWSGNLLWARDGVWLVDSAAAHGGHRETDLAMLLWFGAPHLDTIVAAYDEVAPLADGWRARVALHQLHPMLVHATLFGGGYGERAAAAARAALGAG